MACKACVEVKMQHIGSLNEENQADRRKILLSAQQDPGLPVNLLALNIESRHLTAQMIMNSKCPECDSNNLANITGTIKLGDTTIFEHKTSSEVIRDDNDRTKKEL